MDIKEIEETHGKIAKTLGWAVDKRIVLAVTDIYLSKQVEFEEASYLQTSKFIKKNEGWASPLRSHMHHVASALLTLEKEDVKTGLQKLNAYQEALNKTGFRKSSYTYLAALLMTGEEQAEPAKKLYDEMKQHHKFLTSNEDVPYAVMLSRLEGQPEERAATMNIYYRDLREQGFYMGNDLQWLSQVMTFSSPVYDPKRVGRVLAIREFFQNENIKIRGGQYPILGFLAVAEADAPSLKSIVDDTKELEQTKLFRWYKDSAFSTAVQLAMRDMADVRGETTIAVSTSLEMLMQAQQAAVMASTNAAIIASSNNSSS